VKIRHRLRGIQPLTCQAHGHLKVVPVQGLRLLPEPQRVGGAKNGLDFDGVHGGSLSPGKVNVQPQKPRKNARKEHPFAFKCASFGFD
jgi:hypothetical protein